MKLKDYYRYGSMLIQARRNTIIYLVWGGVLFLLGLLGLIPFLSNFKSGAIPFVVFFALFIVAGVAILIPNLMVCIKPETSKKITSIENLEMLLEDLDKNEIYKDGFFYVSEKTIYSIYNPLLISDRADVLAAWVHVNRSYGVDVSKTVNVYTTNGDYTIPVSVGGQGVQQIFETITQYCPNCKIGFTPANKKYVSDMRKAKKK